MNTDALIRRDNSDAGIVRVAVSIDSKIFGFVMGVLGGLIILAATLWLVLKGGYVVGPHLALLAQFFPGYSVTLSGSLIGSVYGFLAGYLIGRVTATLYNRFLYRRRH